MKIQVVAFDGRVCVDEKSCLRYEMRLCKEKMDTQSRLMSVWKMSKLPKAQKEYNRWREMKLWFYRPEQLQKPPVFTAGKMPPSSKKECRLMVAAQQFEALQNLKHEQERYKEFKRLRHEWAVRHEEIRTQLRKLEKKRK